MLGSIDFTADHNLNPNVVFDVVELFDEYELMSHMIAGIPLLNIPSSAVYFIRYTDDQGSKWYSSAHSNQEAVKDAISLLQQEVVGMNCSRGYTNF